MIDDEPYHDDRERANVAKKLKQVQKQLLALDLDEVDERGELGEEDWKVHMD